MNNLEGGQTQQTGEPGFPAFASFIAGLPRPDAELSRLAAEVAKTERHYADTLARRDADCIGAARGLQVQANLLFLRRLAIIARMETARVERERADIQHEANILRRDFNRAVDNADAAEAKRLRIAAAEFEEPLRPFHDRLSATLRTLELCYARSRRYGSGLGADLQFFPLLSTAMATEAAKAEKQMRENINAAN